MTVKSFHHRKGWGRDRLQQLAAAFAIDVLADAVLSNHLYVVLRNRPDTVATWSNIIITLLWGSEEMAEVCRIAHQNASQRESKSTDTSREYLDLHSNRRGN